jgi:hypothetical protein
LGDLPQSNPPIEPLGTRKENIFPLSLHLKSNNLGTSIALCIGNLLEGQTEAQTEWNATISSPALN